MFLTVATLCVLFVVGCKKDETPGITPTVTSTNPINNATGININSKISATFSEIMDSTTFSNTNFTLKQGTTNIAGSIGYTGKTATFTPTANLASSTIFTATITTKLKIKRV